MIRIYLQKISMEPSNELTANQSLELISRMIREAKGRVQANSFYYLLWGWVILLANLGMFTLSRVGFERPYLVWLITIPAWILSLAWGFRHRSAARTSTHFERVSTALCVSLGVVIFTLVIFGYQINFQLGPIILMISAIPTFTSGVILKFRPLIIGGILFWIAGIVSFILPREFQPLVGAVAIACCYLVPGYMLKNTLD